LLLALLVLVGATATDNHVIAVTLRAAGAAFLLSPWGHRMTTTGGLTLTTTVRVIDRVHDDTTDGWAPALPTHTTGLAPTDVDLVGVADLTDGGAAADVDATDLSGRHTQDRVGAFLTEQLNGGTGGTSQLCTSA